KRKLGEDELEAKYAKSDERGPYLEYPILRSESKGPRPTLVYEYKGFTPPQWGWVVKRDNLIKIDERGDLGWRKNGSPFRKYRPWEDRGQPLGNLWDDIPRIQSGSKEDLGYPTQKPLALLERIIEASSNPGEVVLDPFCGCGTTVHAAQKLGRRWVGIDITPLALDLMEGRLRKAFPDAKFSIEGIPSDAAGALKLWQRSPFLFQVWAVNLLGGQPGGMGADGGVDGVYYFREEKTGPANLALISVKGGQNIQRNNIGDLRAVMENRKATLGFFVTLTPPTKPMLEEALRAGFHTSKVNGQKVPKLQILTIEELMAGKKPQFFDMTGGMLNRKHAQNEAKKANPSDKQNELDL
ncbi:MAG: restriction endonuclease, partial [Alphaproteobacteria bacterium]|nr:restriction endonuclease [Alphaproteobacteria bacterium]